MKRRKDPEEVAHLISGVLSTVGGPSSGELWKGFETNLTDLNGW
jgi:hypothetical protein